jgi:AcrR family transcriptional regulator
MTRIANEAGRPYRSALRERQAEETRDRILEATIRVMATGAGSGSIPTIAREAGVSVPTVYRHFRTKSELMAAIYPFLSRRAGLRDLIMPVTVPEFREMVVQVFSRLETLGDEARLAMSSPASDEIRRQQMPERIAISRRFATAVMPHGSRVEQHRLARVLLVLSSSSAMRMWRDHLGSSVDEAADDIDWVLRAAIASTTGRNDR